MGRCDTAEASVGIRIPIGTLIDNLNEENCDQIREIMTDGFIENENDYKFNAYYDENDQPYANFADIKNAVHKYFDRLRNNFLLYPVHVLISNDRWGYNPTGSHGTAIPIMTELPKIDHAQFAQIGEFTEVLIIQQRVT